MNTYLYNLIYYTPTPGFCVLVCLCVRAGAAAAARLSLSGCAGFDGTGPPGATGQRRSNAERSAGGCRTPEQQSWAHCELCWSYTGDILPDILWLHWDYTGITLRLTLVKLKLSLISCHLLRW